MTIQHTGRIELDLSGHHWKMEKIRPGAGVKEKFPDLPAEYQGGYFSWNQATVPGDVYTDLQRAGEIEDPYYGRNFHKAKWVQEYEYWYVTKFNLPADMQGKHIRLLFEGVDYSCDVWLNGRYLGSHEGMFSPFEFDITQLVYSEEWFEGRNILMVKLDPPPRNYRNVGGRKFCFQGDYMSGVVPFGIWRPIKIQATGPTRLNHVRIESQLQGKSATVQTIIECHNYQNDPLSMTIHASIQGENFNSAVISKTVTQTLSPGTNQISLEIDVQDAQLWWPWDMGEQNLYQLELSLEQDDTCLDNVRETFGIREIKMAMNPGFSLAEVENPWTFLINGKRHYLRSACWGGPPSLLYGRNTPQKYEERLHMVREANINNLRIFGWHPPEVPHFYELCDRLGITVWTNFAFATQAFSAESQFLNPAVDECVAIVKERRNHPANIFWMGGEEVFFSHAHVASDNKQIMEAVGEAVQQVTSVSYALASPMSGRFGQKLGFKPKESSHANEHYYGGGQAFMEEYYTALDFCVIPELTAASAPNIESLKKFIPLDELWPMGISWGYHWADIDILRVLNIEVLGDERTGSLEEFVTATQQAQGIIFQFALEHFRRRKPRVSAVSLCHFMTYSPDIKWGLIDYYGEKKLSYDYVKQSYQPLLVTPEYQKRRWLPGETFMAELWVVNDYHHAYEAVKLAWQILTPAEDVAKEGDAQTVDIAPDRSPPFSTVQWQVAGKENEQFHIEMTLIDSDGFELSKNRHMLLVGDQLAAKQECIALSQESAARREKYGRSYYRYFPEKWHLD